MFPHMRALGDPTELSEERRLAYVGITRARQRLYLSRAKVRSSWGQPMLNPESRFLREIPQELIDWRRIEPRPSFSRPVSGAGRFGSPRPSPARPVGGQAPAAGARTRRSGHPRQVRARPRRGGVGCRRVRDVADRLRQRRPRQADAQPRAGRQAVALGRRSPSARSPAAAPARCTADAAAPGSRTRSAGSFGAGDEQAREDQQRHHRRPPTISSRPIRVAAATRSRRRWCPPPSTA